MRLKWDKKIMMRAYMLGIRTVSEYAQYLKSLNTLKGK